MIRSISGFHLDDVGDWVAELSCYHEQHVRHRPPFRERAWVLDPAGRAARVGSPIDCPPCDRAEVPEGLELLGRLGPWDQESLPRGLRAAHRTAEGRWGLLLVHDGAIDFQREADDAPTEPLIHLTGEARQAIPPGAPHRLLLRGPVRLELEMWGRKPPDA